MTLYILKIKGVAKIPDYVQVRDDKFTLIAYFRIDRAAIRINQLSIIQGKEDAFLKFIHKLPFGLINKFSLNDE